MYPLLVPDMPGAFPAALFAGVVMAILMWFNFTFILGPIMGLIRRVFSYYMKNRPAANISSDRKMTIGAYDVDFQTMDRLSRKNNEKVTIEDLIDLPNRKHK